MQNLRAYEKAGLVHPQRTDGGTRLYSSDDVARLRRSHRSSWTPASTWPASPWCLQLEADNERLRRQVARERTDRERR